MEIGFSGSQAENLLCLFDLFSPSTKQKKMQDDCHCRVLLFLVLFTQKREEAFREGTK